MNVRNRVGLVELNGQIDDTRRATLAHFEQIFRLPPRRAAGHRLVQVQVGQMLGAVRIARHRVVTRRTRVSIMLVGCLKAIAEK